MSEEKIKMTNKKNKTQRSQVERRRMKSCNIGKTAQQGILSLPSFHHQPTTVVTPTLLPVVTPTSAARRYTDFLLVKSPPSNGKFLIPELNTPNDNDTIDCNINCLKNSDVDVSSCDTSDDVTKQLPKRRLLLEPRILPSKQQNQYHQEEVKSNISALITPPVSMMSSAIKLFSIDKNQNYQNGDNCKSCCDFPPSTDSSNINSNSDTQYYSKSLVHQRSREKANTTQSKLSQKHKYRLCIPTLDIVSTEEEKEEPSIASCSYKNEDNNQPPLISLIPRSSSSSSILALSLFKSTSLLIG